MTKSKWDYKDILSHLEEFKNLYDQRPIKNNDGGMKSPHMFPAWYIVKKTKPSTLIESGVWKGLGTWFFEQASPETKIISIDPVPNHRVYTSNKVYYSTKDFLSIDWGRIEKENSIVFFDDHQDAFKRLKCCNDNGFKKIIFEDNYPYQQGDCYSPKKILSNKKYVIDRSGNREWFDKKDSDLDYFKSIVNIYQEMPPIFVDKTTRWGEEWNEETYPTPSALLSDSYSEQYEAFYKERLDYTWLCYIELI